MNIIISNNRDKPIYEQIISQVKNMIISEELVAGDTLPSMRALAKSIHVSVITVQRAYEELQRDGFIETEVGRGTYVLARNKEFYKEQQQKKMEEYRQKFSGNENKESINEIAKNPKNSKEVNKASPIDTFLEKIVLRTGKIIEVARHPDADKLYVLKVDDGRVQDRVIVSGLVGFFTEEELMNKAIVIADNLKPRKMRGIESNGMLLAASYEKEDGSEVLELVSIPDARVGERLTLKGYDEPSNEETKMINADVFFSVPIKVTSGMVNIDGVPLLANGKEIVLSVVLNGDVG